MPLVALGRSREAPRVSREPQRDSQENRRDSLESPSAGLVGSKVGAGARLGLSEVPARTKDGPKEAFSMA